MIGFDAAPRTRLVYGAGVLDRLGELARELPARRVLLVTDPGLVAAGHVERALGILRSAGVEASVFDAVVENPTTREAEACRSAAAAAGIEAFIGLGGGSSLDTAKGGNFLLTNGGRMADYWGFGKAARPMLPLIAVPTTAGTGSECQSYALIADESSHRKMACGDPKAAPRVALLDPTLTRSLPRRVTACTGLDAVAHAMEAAVTKRRNELSLLYARESFRLTHAALPRVLASPDDLEARGEMLLGSAFAGLAIELSMLGAAHAAANPLTAHHDVVHGHAVGLLLPHVIRMNSEDPAAQAAYLELAAHAGLARRGDSAETVVSALAERCHALLAQTGLPRSLSELGVPHAGVAALAAEAAAQWTAGHNPRAMGAADFDRLYHAAFDPIPQG
ncbi:MAG: iron-containing alcohol dehydrogenase [Planctomycetes bacterium]|nr:iron-containing alcohol dehydrogenase [Planctomycetota bacterium]